MGGMAISFNQFFITFGPDMARKITYPEKTEEKLDTVIDGNLCQCLKWDSLTGCEIRLLLFVYGHHTLGSVLGFKFIHQ